MPKARKEVKFFFSYSHLNYQAAEKFKELILQQFGPSKVYEYVLWRDDNILPGENWRRSIENALKDCDLGLLLVSPSFLNSKFVSEVELPNFVGDKKKAFVPVLLSNVNFRRHDLKGLETSQIFRYRNSKNRLKSFTDCSTTAQKEKFCEKLHDEIEDRLDTIF